MVVVVYQKIMMCPSPAMDTEELVGEAAEMMDMAAESKTMIFSPTEKALQAWRHPGTNPSHVSESVCTEPTVDTNYSLACTTLLFYFQSCLHLFLTLNQSWTLVWMRCLDSIWIAPALWYQPSHWNAI
jgi:hypothetical protein